MGTRSLTKFVKNGEVFCCLYRQMDGYVSRHGYELAEFLKNKKIINGFSSIDRENYNFNGMGCLAAAVIAHFKEGTGNFYVMHPGTEDVGEEFVYTISDDNGEPYIIIDDSDETIFSGHPDELLATLCIKEG